jgi:uncharacterized membrane protein YkvA (DUF1232 family)
MDTEMLNKKQLDFYQSLRIKINKWLQQKGSPKWGEYIILAPDLFHLMVRLSLDPEVPAAQKAKLAAAIAYFISPIDLMPEIILGPIGLLDDIAVATYVLHSVLEHTGEEVLRRHWAGDMDILETLQRILSLSDKMFGKQLWGKIRSMF